MEDRRTDGRRQSDFVLGELVGTVREIKNDVGEMREYIAENRTRIDTLTDSVEDKFKTAEVVFKTIRFLALALLAVLTFKFGDVSRLWNAFFS